MKIIPLDPVGVEITEIDLQSATEQDYKVIRDTFIDHQLVLIRNQRHDDPLYYARMVENISSRGITDLQTCNGFANRFVGEVLGRGTKPGIHFEMWPPDGIAKQPSTWTSERPFPVQRVTGEKYQGIMPGLFPRGSLLWHSDKMGPNHVNSTSLMAHTPNNTSTSFIHTPSAYKDIPDDIKQLCHRAVCEYRFNVDLLAPDDPDPHSVNKHLLLKSQKKQNGGLEFTLPVIVNNARGDVVGLYFNFNVLERLHGTGSEHTDRELCDYLKQQLTKPQYCYRHWWKEGDIVLFSQDLTLHSREDITNDQLEKRLLFRYGFHIDPVAI